MALEAFRTSLAGLTTLNVQVEPVNADAESDGLTRHDLRMDVEATLRQRGLAVVDQATLFADVPGTPFLHLDTMAVRLDGRYVYSVRLELWQAVTLVRDPDIRTLAVTWTRPQLVGTVAADTLPSVHEVVRSATEEFLDDCLAAGCPVVEPRERGG
jgi:hypothetical protein